MTDTDTNTPEDLDQIRTKAAEDIIRTLTATEGEKSLDPIQIAEFPC